MESSEDLSTNNGARRRGPIIAIVIVVIVIGAGLGVFFGFYHHNQNNSGTTTIKIAAPIYGSSTAIWEQYLNDSTAGWLKAHPNVKIEFVGPFGASTEGQYYTKLDLMTSSASSAPNIMLEDMFYTSTYVNSGTLMPLNSYMNSSTFGKYFAGALDQMEVNGVYYGLPTQVTDTLIYYNMSLFQQAGIQTPWQPHNWSAIISAAQQIHNTSSLSSVIPLNLYQGVKADEASSFTGFEGLLYGTNWTLYNFTANKWYGENPGLSQTLNFYSTVFHKDGLANPSLSSTPYITVGQYMQQGKLAIAVDGSWMYGYQWAPGAQHPINNFTKYIGVAKIPTEFGQGKQYNTMVGGWGWAAYNGTAHKSLVASLVQSLANTTNSIKVNLPGSTIAGGLPVTTNATQNPLFKDLLSSAPQLDQFYTKILQYGSYRPPVAGYPKASSALDTAMSTVVQGTGTVAQAMSTYSSTLNTTFGKSSVQDIYSAQAGGQIVHNNVYVYSTHFVQQVSNLNTMINLQSVRIFQATPTAGSSMVVKD